jgi:hypothetical protein
MSLLDLRLRGIGFGSAGEAYSRVINAIAAAILGAAGRR